MPSKKDPKAPNDVMSATVPHPTPTNTPSPEPMIALPKKQNEWIAHVKATATKNGTSYKAALSVAKETYKKTKE